MVAPMYWDLGWQVREGRQDANLIYEEGLILIHVQNYHVLNIVNIFQSIYIYGKKLSL